VRDGGARLRDLGCRILGNIPVRDGGTRCPTLATDAMRAHKKTGLLASPWGILRNPAWLVINAPRLVRLFFLLLFFYLPTHLVHVKLTRLLDQLLEDMLREEARLGKE